MLTFPAHVAVAARSFSSTAAAGPSVALGGSRTADDPRRAPCYSRSSSLSRWSLPLLASPRLTM
jgi:hypothetical protein